MLPENFEITQPVLFYDGVCNLCNATVQWVLRHEKKHITFFAAIQSQYATHIFTQFPNIDFANLNSLILYHKGQLFFRSEAAIKLALFMGGIWKLAVLLRIFPLFFRDTAYNFVAKNRYHFFGKKASCMFMQPAFRERFIL